MLWSLRNKPIALLTLLNIIFKCPWKSSLVSKNIPKCFWVTDWVTLLPFSGQGIRQILSFGAKLKDHNETVKLLTEYLKLTINIRLCFPFFGCRESEPIFYALPKQRLIEFWISHLILFKAWRNFLIFYINKIFSLADIFTEIIRSCNFSVVASSFNIQKRLPCKLDSLFWF